MPFPSSDYTKRDYFLPANCKDLMHAIKHEVASVSPTVPNPPITHLVSSSEKALVKYLAEILKVSL